MVQEISLLNVTIILEIPDYVNSHPTLTECIITSNNTYVYDHQNSGRGKGKKTNEYDTHCIFFKFGFQSTVTTKWRDRVSYVNYKPY